MSGTGAGTPTFAGPTLSGATPAAIRAAAASASSILRARSLWSYLNRPVRL